MTSDNVKVVVDKDSLSRFASSNSATLNHLQKYPVLADSVSYLLSYAFVAQSVSVVATLVYRAKRAAIDSPKSPELVKTGYGLGVAAIHRADELFNILVLREGLDAFLEQYKLHDGRAGLWLALYLVDYLANVSNLALRELVVKPLKLASAAEVSGANGKEHVALDDGCPHVKELAHTTRSLSQGIHTKLQSEYIAPTKTKLQEGYNELTKGKIGETRDYVTGKYDAAYQTVSQKYEGNLNKSESVPRAIVSTGVDLGNLTLEKLKNGVASTTSKAEDIIEPRARELAEEVSKTASSVVQGADNMVK
ncbi:LAMI_0G14510g1_1 [Lachancea mirantina]|uniref:LAMI_0G14510g1_1 n=1 Tax=Lachancea mirantina TaxID=1230905 RepID=A0A1G4KC18_9SACH|nr:LAMI_0G14510g1_1 [Lachancea mirantina]